MVYLQDPLIMKQYMRQHSHLVLSKLILYRWVTLSKEDLNALQLVIFQKLPKESSTRMAWGHKAYGARAYVRIAMGSILLTWND